MKDEAHPFLAFGLVRSFPGNPTEDLTEIGAPQWWEAPVPPQRTLGASERRDAG